MLILWLKVLIFDLLLSCVFLDTVQAPFQILPSLEEGWWKELIPTQKQLKKITWTLSLLLTAEEWNADQKIQICFRKIVRNK